MEQLDRLDSAEKKLADTNKRVEQSNKKLESSRLKGSKAAERAALQETRLQQAKTRVEQTSRKLSQTNQQAAIREQRLEQAKRRTELAGRRLSEQERKLNSVRQQGNRIQTISIGLLKRLAAAAAAFVGARALINFLRAGVAAGIAFNAQMETAQLGIAAVLKTVDRTGQFRDYNEAVDQASKLMGQIVEVAPQTTGTIRGLTEGLQVAAGPLSEYGVEFEQLVPLVLNFSQSLAALGIQEREISQEIRGVLAGDTNARQSRLNAILRISKAEIETARENGTVYELLSSRLAAFAATGDRVQNTLRGLRSNFKDIVDVKIGQAFAGTNEALKDLFRTLIRVISSDSFGTFAKTVSDNLVIIINATAEAIKVFDEFLQVYDQTLKATSNLPPFSLFTSAGTASVAVEERIRQFAGTGRPANVSAPRPASEGEQFEEFSAEQEASFLLELKKVVLDYDNRIKAIDDAFELEKINSDEFFDQKFELLKSRLAEETRLIQVQADDSVEARADALFEIYGLEQKFNEDVLALIRSRSQAEQLAIEQRIEAEKLEKEERISIASASASAAASVFAQAGDIAQQLGAGFAAYKAFAIAQATAAGALAVIQALAAPLPPPGPQILAGVTAALAAVQIGIIAASNYSGFEEGGIIPGPASRHDNTVIRAASGELVVPTDVTSAMGPRMAELIRSGAFLDMIDSGFQLGSIFPASRSKSGFQSGGIVPAQQGSLPTSGNTNFSIINYRQQVRDAMESDGVNVIFDAMRRRSNRVTA